MTTAISLFSILPQEQRTGCTKLKGRAVDENVEKFCGSVCSVLTYFRVDCKIVFVEGIELCHQHILDQVQVAE